MKVFKFTKYLPVCILFVLFSCNNASQPAKENPGEKYSRKNSSGVTAGCYQYATDKDTVTLNIMIQGVKVTGTLNYQFYEKDKNKGTIKGRMQGDLLIADYTFMSEGVSSVRQVAFRKGKGVLTEGFGEVQDDNGRMRFRSIDSLQFNTSMPLSEIDCGQ